MDRTKKAMGERLEALRKRSGLTQSDLANASGVPIGTIRNFEQGRRIPLFRVAARLAYIIGCTLDELAGDLGHSRPPKKKRPRKEG
jgi:transcriptional regulator with XRE-family HTH domain